MKKVNKLLVLFMGVAMLAGCNGGNTSSGTPEKSNLEKFKTTYDALGLNYVSDDYYYSKFGQEIVPSNSTLTVQPNGMLNSSTRSGVALAKSGEDVLGYRYGLNVHAGENDSPFVPSYKPGNTFYGGFLFDGGYTEMTKEWYELFYTMPSSEIITKDSQTLYESKDISFDTIFEEGEDEDGNATFTTTNLPMAMYLLDYNSYGRMEGFHSESYYLNVMDILVDENDNLMADNVTVKFTLHESPFSYLYVAIYAKNFDAETPFMERIMYPIDSVPEEEKAVYDLSTVIPEEFYENGPGEEPATVKAKRQAMKEKLTPMIENSNYTLTHTGGIVGEDVFTASVYDKLTTAYSGENNSGAFTYGYYYLQPKEDFSNASDAGIRIYQYSEGGLTDETGQVLKDESGNIIQDGDSLISGMSLANYKQSVQMQGYSVNSEYVATNAKGEKIDLNENLQNIYQLSFNSLNYYLTYDNFWTNCYGGSWEDQLLYNEKLDSFIVSDYYLKVALFGCDTITSNYVDSVSFDLFVPEGEDPYAFGYLYSISTTGEAGFFDFGTIAISNIGTTKMPENFVKYVNEHHGTQYGM